MSELRELLAELEHKQWIKWSQAVADEVSTSRRARWKELWIPYSELTEEQKDQDRVWADQTLAAFKAHIEGCKPEVPLRWRKARDRRVPGSGAVASSLTTGFLEGVEAFRKALMESLE